MPGGSGEQSIYLVNRDSDAVPLANLTVSFENVTENENGCSSDSEAAAENGTDLATGDGDCDQPGDSGEFGDEASHQWLVKPATSSTVCRAPAATARWHFVNPQPNTWRKGTL